VPCWYVPTLVIRGTGAAGDVDGDGLGAGLGDAEAVGDADSDGDADGLADGLADGEVRVPGEVMVCTAGVMSAGTGPGTAPEVADPGRDADTDGEVCGAAGAEARPVAVDERVAAAFGWSCAADGCLAAPDRAKLTAAEAARTPAVTPATASGRHKRRRDIRSRPGEDWPGEDWP
jgi:hypothetical protein